jgi:dipeptidyl-peptidase-4
MNLSFPIFSFQKNKHKSMRNLITLILIGFSFISIGQDISIEKIWKQYQYFGSGFSGFRSMNDGLHFSKRIKKTEKDQIEKFAFKNSDKSLEVIVDLQNLKYEGEKIQVDNYSFNSDESKILFTTETNSIYRRSFTALYFLYDLKSKKLEILDKERSPQMLASYSPDGKKVSYLFENNLYVKDLASNKVYQLTNDGSRNKVINGGTDWVYEEEFAITKAYEWSSDSKSIAFLKFDESAVKEFTMTYHNELYPELYTFKYPKAGEDNSKVSLNMIAWNGEDLQTLLLGEYEYIPRLKFSSKNNQLVVQTLNRYQNHLKYHLVSQTEGKWSAKVFFEEMDEAYVEVDDNLLILKDGKTILRTSERNDYNHIYSLGFDGKITQITKGEWDVIEFKGINEESGTIYYSSAEKGAIHQGVYKIGMDGNGKSALTSETGHNDADFSVGMRYFVKSYSNANTPAIYTLCNNKGKEISVLEDNATFKKKIAEMNMPKKEFIKIKGAEMDLNAWIIKPKNFDATKKYPVYVNIYGGPGSNMVKDEWGSVNFMYHQLLVQNGYIVVSVDPRGTMYRGAKFKKSTYLQLGKLETEDFLAVAKNLSEIAYVDSSRIGIMGWSYGGFMTSLCMTKGKGLYKMGIAVAPVTNWRYYDNIYTERFMRTPQENEDGYDQNSPINFVKDLEGKYLLIHGSGDDNVHYQNTMEMINAMVAANKQFDLFIYPNKNHGIYGGNTRNHLFQMMFDYTLKNL